jgi:phage shock protein PspC (stress-responsive transcriptional regulator)
MFVFFGLCAAAVIFLLYVLVNLILESKRKNRKTP